MKLFFLAAAIAALTVPAESVSDEQEIKNRLVARSGAADAVFNKLTANVDEEEDEELLGESAFNMTAGGRRRRRRREKRGDGGDNDSDGGGGDTTSHCNDIKSWANDIDCNDDVCSDFEDSCKDWQKKWRNYANRKLDAGESCRGDYFDTAKASINKDWKAYKSGTCDKVPSGYNKNDGADRAEYIGAMKPANALRGK